jgi:hypothetical protein
MRALHFIVGMPRSGTTWLGRVLNAHPEVVVFGETDFWNRSFVKPRNEGYYNSSLLKKVWHIQRKKEWQKTTGDNLGNLQGWQEQTYAQFIDRTFARLSPPISPTEVFHSIATDISRFFKKSVAIEKTPNHLNQLTRIAENFPHAKFIVLLREPYGFVTSLRHKDDQQSVFIRFVYRLYRHPLLCSLLWLRYMQAYQTAINNYPHRLLTICTDEIVQTPRRVLLNICRFLGVNDVLPAVLPPKSNSSFPNQRQPPSAAEIFWINWILARYGMVSQISLQPVPRAPLVIGLSFLALPIWISITAILMLGNANVSPLSYIIDWLNPIFMRKK